MSTVDGRRIRFAGVVVLLNLAMATSTSLQSALSVLSGDVMDAFGLTRGQLGVVLTVFSVTGGAASPVVGRLADSDVRKTMAAMFLAGGLGLLGVAVAPGQWILVVGAVLSGLALGAGNPVTNRVIAQQVSSSRIGLVVGLKQSGPPLGLLASGLILPPIAVAFGWRVAVVAAAILPLLGALLTKSVIQESSKDSGRRLPGVSIDVRSTTRILAALGVLVGMGLAAVIAFLPLYAEERLGMSVAMAGAVAAAMGLSGVVGRVLWGSFAARFRLPSTPLLIICGISITAVGALLAAEALGTAWAWVGAIGIGLSMLAWQSVAWQIIIDRAGTNSIGRASGVIQLGNSAGLALGPPIAGVLIDATNSYGPYWAMIGVLFSATLLLTLAVRTQSHRRSGASAFE